MNFLNKKDHPKIRVWGTWTAFLILVWAIICTLLVTDLCTASVSEGVQRFRLDNGFTIILKEDHSSPTAAVQVWVKTGSANETEEEAGITHLIEHMIFKGTPTRKTGEIARIIEASGGSINAYTSYDRTVYHVEIVKHYFDTALDVLLDSLQHSLFDPVELEREKEVVLEEYRRSLDLPLKRLNRSMMKLSYRKHPYRRPVIGYESTIRSLDRKAILNYTDKWYTPDNMVLVAVGDFDTNRTLKMIRSLTKDFPQRTAQEPYRPEEPEQTSLRKIVLNHKVQQVYLDMCWHIPALTHGDIPVLDILEIILGHGKSSRLYSQLKMRKNLVYSIHAATYALADPGLFSIWATLSPEKLNSALKVIAQEASRIGLDPVNESELTRAKALAEADFVFDMESMAGQARTLAFFETMTGSFYHADDYLERLKGVKTTDVSRVARIYLRPRNLSVAVMAPQGAHTTLSAQQITDLFFQRSGSSHFNLKRKENQQLRGMPPQSTSGPDKAPKWETGLLKEEELSRGLRKLHSRPEAGVSSHSEPAVEEKVASGFAQDMKPLMVTLPNGIRIIVKENHHLPVASVTGAFLGGIRLEDPKPWGISGFAAKMLTRGTSKRSASEIATTVESWGANLEEFSGMNSFGLSAKSLSKDLYPVLDLLADVVLDPIFPESEMVKVREDILGRIKAKQDRPTAQLFDLFNKTLFRHHPYGHPQTGTRESIQSIKRSDLVEWYTAHATPSHFVIAVVGDVRKEELVSYIKRLFREFSRPSRGLPYVPPEPPLTKTREAHLERPGAQTHLVIGYLGTPLKCNENAPMALIECALSGQGGRLFSQLRDKASLAYSVAAFRRPGLETGLFGVYLACHPRKLLVARNAIFQELEKVRKEGLTEKELEAAKRYLLGNLKINLQTNGSQARRMALDELYTLGYDYIQQFIHDIEAVSLKDIKDAARKIMVPGKFAFVTVGPGGASE